MVLPVKLLYPKPIAPHPYCFDSERGKHERHTSAFMHCGMLVVPVAAAAVVVVVVVGVVIVVSGGIGVGLVVVLPLDGVPVDSTVVVVVVVVLPLDGVPVDSTVVVVVVVVVAGVVTSVVTGAGLFLHSSFQHPNFLQASDQHIV
jgi:hypothetical protein